MEDENLTKNIPPVPKSTKPLVTYSAQGNPPAVWKSRLLKALRRRPSYISLGKEALRIDEEDEELGSSKLYRQSLTEDKHFKKNHERVVKVLHHLDPDAVRAMIHGDYAGLRRTKLPEQLTEVLDDSLARPCTKDVDTIPKPDKRVAGEIYHVKRPVIYQHWHVDQQGRPPTYDQYSIVADRIQDYVDYIDRLNSRRHISSRLEKVVKAIDTVVKAPHKAGARGPAVFDPDQPRYAGENVLRGARQWIRVTRAVIDKASGQRQTRLSHAVCETGWTTSPNQRRFAQYEHGDQGNKLMNLLDAATRFALRRHTFEMRFIIVAQVVETNLAAAAERLVSRLSSSYSTCGGTNSVQAGLSVESAYRGEKYFQQTCHTYVEAIDRSTRAETKIVREQCEIHRRIVTTHKRRNELDKLQGELEELGRRTAKLEQATAELEHKISSVELPWVNMVDTQLAALTEHEKLVGLSQQMNAIMVGSKTKKKAERPVPATPRAVRTKFLQQSQTNATQADQVPEGMEVEKPVLHTLEEIPELDATVSEMATQEQEDDADGHWSFFWNARVVRGIPQLPVLTQGDR